MSEHIASAQEICVSCGQTVDRIDCAYAEFESSSGWICETCLNDIMAEGEKDPILQPKEDESLVAQADLDHPRGFEFNEEQLEALNFLRDFMEGPSRCAGLYGYAGTGKTSIIQQLIEEFKGRVKTVMAAPTHKAAGVLREMREPYNRPASPFYSEAPSSERSAFVPAYTIHSLLRLRPKKKEGRVFYVPDRYKDPPIYDYKLVILDECSMVDQELWNLLLDEVGKDIFGVKVICMGDPLQLPPVGDNNEESPTFDLPSFRLTKVMRHGGVIGDAVDAIRDNIDSKRPVVPKPGKDDLGEILRVSDRSEFDQMMLEKLGEGASAKMLAFTNKSVNSANRRLRKLTYGDDVDPFIEGEIVVAREAYAPPPLDWESNPHYRYDSYAADVLLRTEQQFQIRNLKRTVLNGMECWSMRIPIPGKGYTETIYTLDRAQEIPWKREVAKARKSKDWKTFWPLKELFAALRPHFATTIHKSQGSTYDYVFLDLRDVLVNSRWIDARYRNRLMYVGCSRARKGLVIYDGQG